MTEKLAEDQGPSLIKERWSWNPKSFSNRAVEPEKLHILLEAARGTPSYKNEQPWNFIIVTSEDADSYNNLLACLPEVNASWARHAPVLMLSVVRLNFESDGARNKFAFFDLAQAVSNIALRAKFLGLQVRQIAGFDAAMTRRRFQVPEGHDPVAVIALGYPRLGLPYAGLPYTGLPLTGLPLTGLPPDPLCARRDELQGDGATAPLRSIESMAFSGRWGQPGVTPEIHIARK
jgi:nitroreductase